MCALSFTKVSLMNVAILAFGAYIFRIESSFQKILPLTSMKCPSLSFFITLGWKLILFYIRMATPACFLGQFAWKIVFQPFTLRYCLSLSLTWVSCMLQSAGYYLSILNCGFLIGMLCSLMLRNINDQRLLIPVILLLEVELYCVVLIFWVCS